MDTASRPGPPRTLTTPRLILRPLADEDIGVIARLANDRQIAFNTASIRYPYHGYWARQFVTRSILKNIGDQDRTFVITLRSNPRRTIGLIGVHQVTPDTAVLGYWIGAAYRRLGYTGEAARAVCAMALQHFSIRRIKAQCLKTNRGSQRVLRKSGFKFVGRSWCKSTQFNRYLLTLVFALERD